MCDLGRLELTGQFGILYRQVYRKVSKQGCKQASKQTSLEVSGHGSKFKLIMLSRVLASGSQSSQQYFC